MKKNVGTFDRAVRFALAVVVLILILLHVVWGALAIVIGIIAAILLVVGLIGYCPLYVPFKFSTRKGR